MKKHKKLKFPKDKKLFIAALVVSLILLISGFLALFNLISSHKLLLSKTLGISSTNQKQESTSSASLKSKTATASGKIKIASIPKYSGKSTHIPILMYHYIRINGNQNDPAGDTLSVTPDKFDAQMGYLKQAGYNPITLDTLYANLIGGVGVPSKPIVLTFDDGYEDFFTAAFPILEKYNFHAVSFIPTGLMDQSYYLHWDQIKQMDNSGLISFQAHSITHPNLTALNYEQEKHEIAESKRVLEERLGKTVNFFAYPYGISDETSWSLVKNTGFMGAVGTWFGSTETEGTLFDMPRVRISGSIDQENFIKLMSGL